VKTNRANKALAQLALALQANETAHFSDGQLLTQFLGRQDESAFTALVRRHAAMVIGVCRRVLGNADDADDAFQATFLVLVRKARALRSRAVLGDWLHEVARRTALKAKGAALRRLAKEHAMARTEALGEQPRNDWLPLLDEELSKLPEKYRLPIILCELEGKTRKEAARQLGWREGTVAGRLARGRTCLAKRLLGRGLVLPAGGLAAALSAQGASACATGLILNTIKAASLIAADQSAARGVISAKVAALTGDVMKAMLLSKLKNVAVVLVVCMLGGFSWVAYDSLGDETDGVKAQTAKDKPVPAKVAKVAQAAKKSPTLAELTRKSLNDPMPSGAGDGPMTLKEALESLEKNYGFPKFAINNMAFRLENPDVPDFLETQVIVPNVPGISKVRLLRLILDQIPTANAAFLLRTNVIEITTNERSIPANQFVDGNFEDVPLDEVLAELSDRTGVTIVIDTRARDKAKTPVSARLQHETNLATAVRLLADMADLKLVVVDRVLYVTLPSNKGEFPPGELPGFKQKRIEAA
jgi:RNA polymerase sigma factor (sigma-70 family)